MKDIYRIIKSLIQLWIIKYWYVFSLALIIGFGGAAFRYKKEQEIKHFSCNFLGCTLLLNYSSLFVYLAPIINQINEGEQVKAAQLLGMKERELQFITRIDIQAVNEVTEESDVRYELNLIIDLEKDTTGLASFEQHLVDYIKKHRLLVVLQKDKMDTYLKNKAVIENNLINTDSLLRILPNADVQNGEILRKRKTEMQLELNNLASKSRKVFDLEIIQHCKETLVEKVEKYSVFLRVWLLFSMLTSVVIVFLVSKEFRQVFFME